MTVVAREEGPPPARLASPVALRAGLAGCEAARRPMTHDQLQDLIGAVAARKDYEAFVALFRHFAPRVKSYLIRCGTPAAVAEDLAQETMVILWRRADSFDPQRAALSTWVFTIARNLRIDHHRHAATDAASCHVDAEVDVWEPRQQHADPQAGPDELAQAAERERDVQQALHELPAEHARVLQLSFFEEHSHAAIARELAIPLGTVKSRIRLAVAQLRRKMERLKP